MLPVPGFNCGSARSLRTCDLLFDDGIMRGFALSQANATLGFELLVD